MLLGGGGGWGLGCSQWRERERETAKEGRERKLERGDFFFLYILVDNIYYFNG